MAISVNQIDFEEMGAWLRILQIVENSTLLYLLFDTHDISGSVFIWESKFTIGFGIVGNIWVKSPCRLVWYVIPLETVLTHFTWVSGQYIPTHYNKLSIPAKLVKNKCRVVIVFKDRLFQPIYISNSYALSFYVTKTVLVI